MRLENKVAFISGGARGMGATEARMFSREGCKVVIGDLRDELGRQVEAEINELGGECLYVHLDVTDEQSWKRCHRSCGGAVRQAGHPGEQRRRIHAGAG